MTRVGINKLSTGKIPPGDPQWVKFNDSFENRELETIDFANEIYLGHSYAPWFNGRRKAENFVLGQHLAIDMDSGDDRSSLDTLRNHPLIELHGALLHTTPSHTVDHPRARAIFVLDEPIYDPNKYAAAARFLISQFDGADPQCSDAGRFFYGSRNCDIEYYDRRLPIDRLREYYRRWSSKQNRGTNGAKNGVQTANGVNVPQSTLGPQNPRTNPVSGAQTASGEPSLADIAAELRYIDPWGVDYDEWVRILMAIHHVDRDAGLALAEQWGRGAPGEIPRKWKSFNETGNFSGTVTGRTIFGISKRFK